MSWKRIVGTSRDALHCLELQAGDQLRLMRRRKPGPQLLDQHGVVLAKVPKHNPYSYGCVRI